jgi:hypothetical protein
VLVCAWEAWRHEQTSKETYYPSKETSYLPKETRYPWKRKKKEAFHHGLPLLSQHSWQCCCAGGWGWGCGGGGSQAPLTQIAAVQVFIIVIICLYHLLLYLKVLINLLHTLLLLIVIVNIFLFYSTQIVPRRIIVNNLFFRLLWIIVVCFPDYCEHFFLIPTQIALWLSAPHLAAVKKNDFFYCEFCFYSTQIMPPLSAPLLLLLRGPAPSNMVYTLFFYW